MTEEERWQYLLDLDEELLIGGVTLSEWCCFIVKEADIAFAHGAHLASILTAVAGAETYLRAEYGGGGKATLYELIDASPLKDDLKRDLQSLREYRNRWVHVRNPQNDQELQNSPEKYEAELEAMAKTAARTLRRTLYENQWL